MKLSRRGFIRSAPAAVAAAPAVATAIAKEQGMYLGGYSAKAAMNTAYHQTSGPISDYPAMENLAADRLKELIASRARLEAEHEGLGEQVHYVEAQRIDGLKSVSAANKARMAVESDRRRALAAELKYMDKAIAELKKDYPVLAYLAEALT